MGLIRYKNKTNINSIINKLFESSENNNLKNMRKTLVEDGPFSGSKSGGGPFSSGGGGPFSSKGGSSSGGGGPFSSKGGSSSGGGNNQGNTKNSNINSKTNVQAGIDAGFPDCIVNINFQSGNIDPNGNWVVTDGGTTYIFTKDFKYTTNAGASGTWQCNGNDNVKLGSANQQQTAGFPDCVTSFRKVATFYYSVGKNSKGEEVELFFTNTARQGGYYLAIATPMGNRNVQSQVKLIYNCDNGLTITDMYGSPYTIGSSTNTTGSQKINLNADQSEIYDTVKEYNDFLGLKVVTGNYRLNSIELTQATEAVISGINGKYRSNGFGYYAAFLESLIEFYTSMGEKYQRYTAKVTEDFNQIKTAVSTATNEQYRVSNQSNWNPLTNPPQKDIASYAEIKFDKAPFTIPFNAYVLKGQNMTANAARNIDANLATYMSGNTLDSKFCKTTIDKLLACIQYQETGLFKKKAKSVTSCEDFDISELKAMKQVVANCARQRIITDKNQMSALADEGLEDRYRVSFASRNSINQPPLQ